MAPLRPAAAAALVSALLLTSSLAVAAASSGPVLGLGLGEASVLLPPAFTGPVQYRLLATQGCFVWSWDHHDILFVQPEFNGSDYCSTSARLISIAPYSRRKVTAVHARDRRTGIEFNCKVVIDMVSRIEIFYPGNKVNLGDHAKLRIRAYDSEENEFSSLVGSQFFWQIVPNSTDAENIHHLVHVPLKEISPSDCGGFCGDLGTQIQLEDGGGATDLYVVKGIRIGHEVVSAQLLGPHLEHLSVKIVLTVAETTSLYPPSQVTAGARLLHPDLNVTGYPNSTVVGDDQTIDYESIFERHKVLFFSLAVAGILLVAVMIILGCNGWDTTAESIMSRQTNMFLPTTRLTNMSLPATMVEPYVHCEPRKRRILEIITGVKETPYSESKRIA